MTQLSHDLAVELHLSAQHAASRRSEVHGAVSNAEALAVHVNHSVEAATTSLCETVWLLWDPNLSEDARRCLQPDGAHAWRMLLQIVTHGLLALQETPGAHMLCVPLCSGLVLLGCRWTHSGGWANSMTVTRQSNGGRGQVLLSHQQDDPRLRGGQSAPPHGRCRQR